MKCLYPPVPVCVATIQEALSGRAHTTMLATVSPSSNSYVETMNTLKYAERLKRASAHLGKDSGGQRITKVRYRMAGLDSHYHALRIVVLAALRVDVFALRDLAIQLLLVLLQTMPGAGVRGASKSALYPFSVETDYLKCKF